VGPGDGTVGPPNAYVIQLPGPWMDDFNAVLTYVAAASPDRVSVATIDHVIRPDLGAYRFDGVHYTKLGAHVLAETLNLSDPPLLIVASRLADEYLWAEALNLGAYDVLAKPFDADEVVRVLRSAWFHKRIKCEIRNPTNMKVAAAG